MLSDSFLHSPRDRKFVAVASQAVIPALGILGETILSVGAGGLLGTPGRRRVVERAVATRADTGVETASVYYVT